MILLVREGGVTLVDLDDLRSLSAQIAGDAAIGTWGRRQDGHVFVTTETLLRLAGERASDRRWRGEFDGMVDFARRHGWMHGDEVRMHVVAEPDGRR
ncbi:hypothetical protein OHA72_35940 [Dactylosporangium sp. NBC_01737]|uniref:hypothetical protein n=1 Tax=Dactylosporangium sp. NBC_01737 TaxID=2975959 RepID=UPI002E12C05D|nr:hypothetical protein OHA72_35940 [Dactylosporangium sp. NBC_01737]